MRNVKLYLFVFSMLITSFVMAQENLATFNGGGVRVDNAENIRVDGNVYNEGNVRLETNSIIYLHGDEWSNHTVSSTGIGDVPGDGWVYFIKNNSSITGASIQLLDGNNAGVKGTGSSFPRIKILNVDNVRLTDNGTRVRAQVDFAINDGHVITNFENVYMSSTATFTQYTEQRYVVTNGTPTSGGFVRKENLSGAFTFPIGTAELDYTPATLTNSGTADCYDGRVFTNTFLDGTSGGSYNQETVAKTWKFEEAVAGGSNVLLDLQHNSPTNGTNYDPTNAYVTNYIGTVGNTNGGAASPNKWDLVSCPNSKAETSPGTMTTGAPISQALMLDRTFTDFTNYTLFSKNSNEFPSVTASMTPDDCDGSGTGTATANGMQGITPYTYQWSNGQTTQTATSLTAGTYMVTILDVAGCTDVATIVVAQNAAITLNVSGSNATCNSGNDGTATATANGGTPPLQYNWNNGQTTATASGLTAGTYTVSVSDGTGCLQTQTITITEPAAITISFNVTNVPCDGTNSGTATATPAQGTAPFSYNWNNGQTNQTATALTAGTYTVTVTDNDGCTAISNVIVNQNSSITLSLNGGDVTCYNGADGTATSTAGGGTPPFQYNWSNGQTTPNASGLSAGTYSLSVTDGTGCTRIESITITEPAEITVSFNVTNVTCESTNNGTATATPAQGTAPFSYNWNNGQTNQTATALASGTYMVTITDNDGCTAIDNITVNQNPDITLSVAGVNATCNSGNDGTATATAGGGTPPLQYSWSNGQTTSTATALSAGTYTVSVTDGTGCLQTQTITITEPAAISVSFNVTNVACETTNTGTATATPAQGTAPFSYNWNNGQTGQTATALTIGTYTVTITDNNGCTAMDNVTVNQNPDIAVTVAGTNTTCNSGNDGTATATANGGTPPLQYSWNNGQTTSTATALSAGTYTVSVTDGTGCLQTETITITEPSAITVSFNVTNVACESTNNGTATATPAQGTAPFSYNWNNGQTSQTATALTAGTYTVTITDTDGCTAIDNVTVNQNPDITLSVAGANTTCNNGNDGTATATANGGTPPLQYSWNNGQSSATATALVAGTYTVSVSDATGCLQTETITITEPAAITVSFNVTNVACESTNSGTATATPAQGTAPFSYNWNNGQTSQTATALTAGTYTVTITDNDGCTAIDNVTVNQNPDITLTVAGSNATCNSGNDGTATATAGGGTPPLQYSWNNGQTTATASGLTAGTYTVSVTDGTGCLQTQSVTITEPAAITVSFIVTSVTCQATNNGTATATPAQGTAPFSYSWSDGQTDQVATALTAGTYTVTITDNNGCTAIDNVTVNQNPDITLTVAGANITCNGGNDGTATATANGGTPPLQYSWDNGQSTSTASGLVAGTYTVSVSDGTGCLQTQTVTITEPAEITITFNATNVPCDGTNSGTATATPVQGTAPFSYEWSDGQMTQTASGLGAGSYTVTVTDNDGCTAIDNVIVNQNSNISLTLAGTDVTCYNGTDGTANSSASGGTPPLQYNWSNGQMTVNASGLSAGIYTLSVSDATGCTRIETITITEPAEITVSFITSDVSCQSTNNGTAIATPSQGTAPFTYEWDNGQMTQTATALTAGTYQVTITDTDGCSVIDNVTIDQNPDITLSVAGSNVTCYNANDGTATATAGGGTPPFQYTWNDGQTTVTSSGLVAGTYTVSVIDATGCLQTETVTITEPAEFVLQFNVTNVTCGTTNSGTATATTTQGTAPYSYEWDNGQMTQTASGLVAGNYVVTLTDADGCSAVSTVTVNQNPTISLGIDETDADCNGEETGQAIANATGGTTPFQYLWSDGQTNMTATALGAGTYTVTVVDATGCTEVISATINEPDLITIIFTPTNVSCDSTDDGMVTAINDGGVGPFTYQWDAAAGNQTTSTAINLAVGTYEVTMTDASGCRAIADVSIDLDECNPCPADYCTQVLVTNADICVIIGNDPGDPLANLDCDGDGVTNSDECTDGTDPLDPCDYVDTSITLPVIADQTECPQPCPDLTPIMTILPGNIAGSSPVEVAVQVTELEGIDTDGSIIIIRIPSDPRFVFTWDPTLTTAALVPILNTEWNYLGDNGFVHTWTYNGPGLTILANGVAGFGFQSNYDPQSTDGQTTLTATILPFSGGECNILNNTDSERLVYFE